MIGDRRGEGAALGNLGVTYAQLGEYGQAIGYLERALAIDREIGDRQGEANDLNNIGALHADQGDYAQAIVFFEQARNLFMAMGMQHRVELVEGSIKRARAAMAGGGAEDAES